MSVTNLLAVALGGAIGASLRYGAYHLLHGSAAVAPHWAIGLINLLGCLAIGLLFGWLDTRGIDSERLRVFLAWGILGAFTTFS
ncbi:MAG: CrcB family protein, partial [Phycisphaerales bacterium]|nr:CrcB family protein [Phycisphaerales bacterium]